MKELDVKFPCGQLTLEGICFNPDAGGSYPAVVLCHPHPLYGGSMHNNIIMELALNLVSESIIAFMFNFRGVGDSEGSYAGGIGEQEDVVAAMDWLVSQSNVDNGKLGLAGYSFGGSVAAPVACDDKRIKAVVLISPAMETAQINKLKKCVKPKLIISGSDDDIISLEEVHLMIAAAADPKQSRIFDGADHFWSGYEGDMAEIVTKFFSEQFK